MNAEKAVVRLTKVIRRKHLALATERSYCAWLRRYCDHLKGLPAHLSSERKLELFLNAPAQKNVAARTQNQAFVEKDQSALFIQFEHHGNHPEILPRALTEKM
jgi:Phage integrase, N-terminal SAM-like domain